MRAFSPFACFSECQTSTGPGTDERALGRPAREDRPRCCAPGSGCGADGQAEPRPLARRIRCCRRRSVAAWSGFTHDERRPAALRARNADRAVTVFQPTTINRERCVDPKNRRLGRNGRARGLRQRQRAPTTVDTIRTPRQKRLGATSQNQPTTI